MTLPGVRRHGLQCVEFQRSAGLQFSITILEIRTWMSPKPNLAPPPGVQAAVAPLAASTPP